MFFEDYTEKLWGINPKYIAADWGAQRVKGLSLTKAVINVLTKPFKKKEDTETSLIEQFYYPKKGPGQLWEALADEIEKLGGRILHQNSVKTLKLDGKRIKSVGVETPDGFVEYSADYYISTMPVKDLVNGMGEEVPNTVKDVALNLPYRDFMTVGVLVDKLLLENKTKHKTLGDIVPDCWIYIQERDVKLGRLQIFNNWSPYMVKDPENTVWVGLEYFCNEGDEYWNMSDREFTEFALDELEKIGIINKADVKDTVRIRVKKAYPAYFGTYNEFHKVREYLDGIDNLYCIGRNGMHRYNNMDHSMLTAMEAVNCIKDKTLSKSSIWNVNTEQEYHEEK
jgi:protoporphyrinogen oxidase